MRWKPRLTHSERSLMGWEPWLTHSERFFGMILNKFVSPTVSDYRNVDSGRYTIIAVLVPTVRYYCTVCSWHNIKGAQSDEYQERTLVALIAGIVFFFYTHNKLDIWLNSVSTEFNSTL